MTEYNEIKTLRELVKMNPHYGSRFNDVLLRDNIDKNIDIFKK